VIAEAIRQLGEWQKIGLELKLSVNISTRDLLDNSLPDYVQGRIAAAGIAPSQLCLEITESGFMEEPEHALAILHRLHDLGLSLSIDDYGTGYSSLAYVKKLPVNELKIDRAFIMNMTHNKGDEMIVRSTIDLGHNLGLSVVAEGIDDEATLEMLRQLGCDYAQGFLISKPMPAAAFVEWLSNYKS
jgi:EAL domain-containing protein (putative c-di-GMP-specific phosphodiesterase class I)